MAYQNIKAMASVTIVDETEASSLTGTMLVIKGSKNQIYLTGQSNPYSPDWRMNHLVVRPFLQASNIIKSSNGNEYNPDIFSPEENYYNDCIKDIHWYLRDSAGVENEIYESSDFSLSYVYEINGQKKVCSDGRQLVLKSNVLSKNGTADLVCKFSFYDSYSMMTVQQQFEINLVNIASGQAHSKLVTSCVNGASITNDGEKYVDIVARFYGDSGEENIGQAIESGMANVSCRWYIRNMNEWYPLDTLLLEGADPDVPLFEPMKISSYDDTTNKYEFEKYIHDKGSEAIRIYPALVQGSAVIKCEFTDYSAARFYSIETILDATDATKVDLPCSNGKRLRKGSDIESTIIKAVITQEGKLIPDEDPRYETDFAYYWYKYTVVDDKYVNVVNDEKTNDIIEIDLEHNDPEPGKRELYVDTEDISSRERQALFSLVLVDKKEEAAQAAQANYYAQAITEEDLGIAMALNKEIGLGDDMAAAIFTARELNLE